MSKILCIDDDQDIIECLKLTLKGAGHEVRGASNGDEGYDEAKRFGPDLIILDVMMRDASEGFHTAYLFRKDEALKFKPILMLTSVSEKTGMKFDVKKDGAYLPVDDFISKPVSPEQLVKTAQRLLALSKDEINIAGK